VSRGFFVVAVVLALSATSAFAQTPAERSAARELGNQGLEDFQRGDFPAALDKLQRAHDIVHLPTTGLWLGRTLDKVGRLIDASERYLEVTRMQLAADALPQHVQAKEEAARDRQALLPRIPQVTIVVRGAQGAQVRLDGKPVPAALVGAPQPMDPGNHVAEASLGEAHTEQRFTLAEKESREVVLELEAGTVPPPVTPLPPPVPTPVPGVVESQPTAASGGPGAQLVIGAVALGLGGAGLVLGAVTGGLAIGKKNSLDEGCDADKQCGPELHDDVDSYGTLRIVSAVGLYAGAALAVGGLVLVLTAPSPDAAGSALVLGPGEIAWRGRF
jgi:hypothetical protein